jgi:hypothetical protein
MPMRLELHCRRCRRLYRPSAAAIGAAAMSTTATGTRDELDHLIRERTALQLRRSRIELELDGIDAELGAVEAALERRSRHHRGRSERHSPPDQEKRSQKFALLSDGAHARHTPADAETSTQNSSPVRDRARERAR